MKKPHDFEDVFDYLNEIEDVLDAYKKESKRNTRLITGAIVGCSLVVVGFVIWAFLF